MRNNYFNIYSKNSEQSMYQSLIEEAIRIHGLDVYYLPRTIDENKRDFLFGEDAQARFEQNFLMEMYLKNADNYEGEGDILRKFGVAVNDTAVLTVSRRRFKAETNLTQPREGDLIYIPLSNTLFEIRHVKTENPFYQFGKLYTYDLDIEAFQYTDEFFDTGIREIDRYMENKTYSVTLDLSTGTGTFVKNEAVTESPGSGQATVRSFDASTKELVIYNVIDEFTPGNNVIGASSGASWGITSADELTMSPDGFPDNIDIETEENDILDWSEDHPFGDL